MYMQDKHHMAMPSKSSTMTKIKLVKSAVAIFRALNLGAPDAEAKREIRGRWLGVLGGAHAFIDPATKVFGDVSGDDADKRTLRAGLRAMNYTSTRRRLMRVAW